MSLLHFTGLMGFQKLCRIILTHSHSSGNEITFQRLLGSLNVIEDGKTYSASCARILTMLSMSSRSDDYESCLQNVCSSLHSILVSLYHAKQVCISTLNCICYT